MAIIGSNMKNEMKPVPFKELLEECIREYRENKSLFSVPVADNIFDTPMGPAAGPHTQMAQNIIAAYAAGATVFELKTVQILEGEELGIVKPCIFVGSNPAKIPFPPCNQRCKRI